MVIFHSFQRSNSQLIRQRDYGLDVAIINSTMFFGQLVSSSFLGLVIEKVGSHVVIMYSGSIFGFLASLIACFVEFPCKELDNEHNEHVSTEETNL
jgi:hypothetical protein